MAITYRLCSIDLAGAEELAIARVYLSDPPDYPDWAVHTVAVLMAYGSFFTDVSYINNFDEQRIDKKWHIFSGIKALRNIVQ